LGGAAAVAEPDRRDLVEAEAGRAQGRGALAAAGAGAAAADEADDDAVALGDRRAGTGLDDDPAGLVSEHGGERAAPGAGGVGDVAVADRAGGDPHAHLV